MATPTNFPQKNRTYTAPPGLPDCEPLPAFVGTSIGGGPVTLACWQIAPEELAEVARTGKVWLQFWGHQVVPHAIIGVDPFAQPWAPQPVQLTPPPRDPAPKNIKVHIPGPIL